MKKIKNYMKNTKNYGLMPKKLKDKDLSFQANHIGRKLYSKLPKILLDLWLQLETAGQKNLEQNIGPYLAQIRHGSPDVTTLTPTMLCVGIKVHIF